jgi:glutamine synthetase
MLSAMYKAVKELEEDLQQARALEDVTELGNFYRDRILADMREIRANSDQMETIASAKAWPYPSYGAMLFSVR